MVMKTPCTVSMLIFFSLNVVLFFTRDDLEDIRKEIEREEEKVQTGPPKTRSEVLIKVCHLLNAFNNQSL